MSNTIENDVYSVVKDIVIEETLYLRHYIGQVVNNNDVLGKGRVQVTLPELGLSTPDLAIWCNPRQGNGISVPAIGKYAEVYFVNADRSRPAYLFPVAEIINNTPLNYSQPTDNVLFEDPNNPNAFIKYDSIQQLLQIFNDPNSVKINNAEGTVTILNGAESYVLGDSFLTWLNNFINTVFNAHTHAYVDTPIGPSVTSPPTPLGVPPTNILSLFIKGK